MDWIKSVVRFKFKSSRGVEKACRFSLIHFDNIDYPIIAGDKWEDSRLEEAESLLGSVLWLDAVELFLPFVSSDIAKTFNNKILTSICLGEGTGACGIGLGVTEMFSKVVITDLPTLVPLLELNAQLTGQEIVVAQELDWTKDEYSTQEFFDVIVGCEVLYGNRFVWDYLMKVILCRCHSNTVVYICVTLRNARKDLEDFRDLFLEKYFSNISEIQLSDNVCVLRSQYLL
jgi:hypothetical protein